MRIFIAGASGAVGRRLVPFLVANGHQVFGTTRTYAKTSLVREMGADPVILDALDHEAVLKAVAAAHSNADARQAMKWQPEYSSWRQGFRLGLEDRPSRAA